MYFSMSNIQTSYTSEIYELLNCAVIGEQVSCIISWGELFLHINKSWGSGELDTIRSKWKLEIEDNIGKQIKPVSTIRCSLSMQN